MKRCDDIYPPVTRLERRTSHCPLYVALRVLDEVRNHFWTDVPESLADELAHRAEIVFERNARWRTKIQGRHGREYLEMFMRHWLSSALFKRKSPLFRQLPGSFKWGAQLPITPLARQLQPPKKKIRRKRATPLASNYLVHG